MHDPFVLGRAVLLQPSLPLGIVNGVAAFWSWRAAVGAVPLLVTVKVSKAPIFGFGTFGKVKLDTSMPSSGVGCKPVADSASLAESPPESAMVTVVVSVPTVDGLKVASKVHVPPFLVTTVHVLDPATYAKSVGFVPPANVGPPSVPESVWPELVTVKVTGADVRPCTVVAKVLPGFGVMASVGFVSPVPESVSVAACPDVSVTPRVVVSTVAVDGVNATWKVHAPPLLARNDVQLLAASAKLPLLPPW